MRIWFFKKTLFFLLLTRKCSKLQQQKLVDVFWQQKLVDALQNVQKILRLISFVIKASFAVHKLVPFHFVNISQWWGMRKHNQRKS